MTCLDELRKQQVIDKKVYYQKLMDDTLRKLVWDGLQKNIVKDGDTMIERRTGEVLDPEVNSTCWRFHIFVEHKSTCRKVEELYILNGTDTLGT